MVLNHSLFSVVTCASHSVGIWIIVICFYARAWTVQLLSSEAATCLMLFSFLCMLHQSFCARQGIKNDSRKLASGFAFKAKKFIGAESKVHKPKGHYKFIKAEVSLVAAAGGSNSFSTGTKLLFIDDESGLQCSMLPRYPPLGL